MQKTFPSREPERSYSAAGPFRACRPDPGLESQETLIAMDGNLAKLGMRDKIMEMFDRKA
jgi:hypothetical protein